MIGFLHNPNPGSTEYVPCSTESNTMDIVIQISGYLHDGDSWVENQPYRCINVTLTDPDNDRKSGREIAKAVRDAGYYGRPTVPFGKVQEYDICMFQGSSLGFYFWFACD